MKARQQETPKIATVEIDLRILLVVLPIIEERKFAPEPDAGKILICKVWRSVYLMPQIKFTYM